MSKSFDGFISSQVRLSFYDEALGSVRIDLSHSFPAVRRNVRLRIRWQQSQRICKPKKLVSTEFSKPVRIPLLEASKDEGVRLFQDEEESHR